MQKISAIIIFCAHSSPFLLAESVPLGEPAQSAISMKFHPDDGPTRDAFDSFYNSDYEPAIQGFEKSLKAHPDDPFAVNHLLEVILVREIDREGALNAELYLGTDFLRAKRMLVDGNVRMRIQELTRQALQLSEERLKTKPDDVDALYARGITRSLAAMNEGLIEKAWYSAFRDALGAYNDHKRVLELAPNYSDAKVVVGVYNYIVAVLPVYERVVAFMLDIKGGKAEGIESIREAANAGGETSVDAKTALSLFLAREHQYPEGLSLVHELYRAYPHNFHFGLSEANMFRASGRIPEAIAAYRDLLALGQRGAFPQARMERAAIALGQIFREQGNYQAAANAVDSVAQMPGADHELVARVKLLAGQMYDLSRERDAAVKEYQEVIAMSGDPAQMREAKRLLKDPYREP